MINNQSEIKRCIYLKLFTNIIQICLKYYNNEKFHYINDNKKFNNILYINYSIIQKVIEFFNNYKFDYKYENNIILKSKPSKLLKEFILDNNVYQVILDVITKKISQLKIEITKDLDLYLNNKKIELFSFNKNFPNFELLSIVKFINKIKDVILKKFNVVSNNNSEEYKKEIEKYKTIKKEYLKQYRSFIQKINEILISCWEQINKLSYDINYLFKDKNLIPFSKFNRLPKYIQSMIILSYLNFIFYRNNPISNIESIFIIEKYYESDYKSPLRNNGINNKKISYCITK